MVIDVRPYNIRSDIYIIIGLQEEVNIIQNTFKQILFGYKIGH
jgi:hypothetical protein